MTSTSTLPQIHIPRPAHDPKWVSGVVKGRIIATEHHSDPSRVPVGYLLSVWPLAFRHSFRASIGELVIEACPRGEYRVLRVFEAVEVWRDYTRGQDGTSQGEFDYETRMQERRIPPSAMINDFKSAIASSVVGTHPGLMPGIIEIAAETPTDAEWASVVEMQSRLALHRVREADRIHGLTVAGVQTTEVIIPLVDRALAEFAGITDTINHPWISGLETRMTKRAPCCTRQIPADARVCPECRTDLLEFYVKRYLTPDAKEDPVIAADFDRIRGAQAAQAAAQLAASKVPASAARG